MPLNLAVAFCDGASAGRQKHKSIVMAVSCVYLMRGPNRLKLGVFSMNSDGGLTLTRVPERWQSGT